MSLRNRLTEYVKACFTGLWIESQEHQDALTEIAQLCHDEQWQLATWDIESGLSLPGVTEADVGSHDPLAAIRAINTLATPNGTAILVLQNFHRFTQSAEIVQALYRQIVAGKQNRTIVVILSPVVQIPTELEKMIVVIEHHLPDRDQLEEIARGIATEEGELPEGAELDTILDAAAGLTRMEAENAFSLSLVRQERISAEAVWELKSQMLKKSGLLSLYRGSEDFSSLGGLSSLKAFCKRSLSQSGRTNPNSLPRGTLLLGVPGTGKSAFAKALGRETQRPTLVLDIGALMGSLVGQTEHNIRQALRIADAMAPCILFCDEVEKALSGAASSSQTDSGVSARMFGTLLSWMNDHRSDVYLIATCNDISKLPPEFSRAERFDAVVFLDLPGSAEKQAIWEMYLKLFEIDADQPLPEDENWTGAEVKACCRLSALLDVPLLQAAQNVVPVAVTAAESVERLRSWASGRCLSANQPGIYHHNIDSPKSRRRVSRDPSIN
ncbi:MAG: AAA family ATPase [Blastopirellula sp.]|nr:MAG: AAA family ATPase [Blastopirellula sp.]